MSEHLKIAVMRESHYAMIPETLRVIAGQVADGDFGDVSCAALVLRSEKDGLVRLDVFGTGEESAASDVFTVLHAGAFELLRMNGMVKTG